jgi:hypothetical protein
MAEINNNTLAVFVFAALAAVLAGSLFIFGGGITGFATSDSSANISLTINSSLNIQVNASEATIAFGACTPRAGSTYTCASNDTEICDGLVGLNCTGDTATPQYIEVDNVGNVNASVNVSSSCSAAQLIGGSSPAFKYTVTDCDGGGNYLTWASFTTDAAGSMACNNTMVGGTGFRLYANVTIPNNANPGGCSNDAAVLTFSAISAS